MDNLARQLKIDLPELAYGLVQSCQNGLFSVRTETGLLSCRKADGCLLRPEAGDKVLVSTCEEHDCQGYVLSVICKAESTQPAELHYEGDLRIRTSRGDLTLATDRDLNLVASQRASVLSRTLTAGTETAELRAEKVSMTARLLRGSCKAVLMVAENVEHTFSQLTQRLRNSVRMVEEHEEISTGSSRLAVENNYVVHTANEFHSAEDLIKLDGEEVHLG